MTWNWELASAPCQTGLACILGFFVAAVHSTPGWQKTSQTRRLAVEPTSSSSKEVRGADLRLPAPELFAAVAALGTRERFRKGQVIFTEGAVATELFAVKQGLVKLAVTREDGKEVILDIIADHDFFGEEALICPGVARHYNVISITDAQITKIDSKQIRQKLRENTDMAEMFLLYALKRTKAVQEHLANCLLNPGTKRLAYTLMANEDRLGQPEKLDQQTLGEMIGMTRQYVNFLLRELRRSNAHRQETGSTSLPQSFEQHQHPCIRDSRPLNRKVR